jgi:hypothetical protein
MIEASCHCRRVRIGVPQAPETVNECTCSICRRYGTLWAYYSPKLVEVSPAGGATDIYMWGYMWGARQLEFHRCKECGCITHWAPVDESYDRMGVNARLMQPEMLAAASRLVDNGRPR